MFDVCCVLSSMFICCVMCVACCLVSVARGTLAVVCRVLLVAPCWIVVVRCVLSVGCSLLFVG